MTLRYVSPVITDGFRNMAVDETFFEGCKRGAIDGALRVYGWAPPAVSLGHGQPIDLIDPERCMELGVDVVRRITGGGAVLHWEEVTYCLVLRRELWPRLAWPRQFARLTGLALCGALESLGVDASLSSGGARLSRNRAQPALCFSSGAENEVVVDGRKLAGCAHKFTKEVFFSHGSVMTGRSHLRILDLVGPGAEPVSPTGFGEKCVCLSELLQDVPGIETVGRELRRRIEGSLGVSFDETPLSAREEESANERASEKRRDAEGFSRVVDRAGLRRQGSFS